MRFSPEEILFLKRHNFEVDKNFPNKAYSKANFHKNPKDIQIVIIKAEYGYYKELLDAWTNPIGIMSPLILDFEKCVTLETYKVFWTQIDLHREKFLKACASY